MEWKPEVIFMRSVNLEDGSLVFLKNCNCDSDHELQLTLISEGELKSKRKKSYNVTDEQVAFNF